MGRRERIEGVEQIDWQKPVAYLGAGRWGDQEDRVPIFLTSGSGQFRTKIKGGDYEQADDKGFVEIEAESLEALLAKIGSLARKRPRLMLPVIFVEQARGEDEPEEDSHRLSHRNRAAVGEPVILTGIDGRTGTVRFQKGPNAKPEAAYSNPRWIVPVDSPGLAQLRELAPQIYAAGKRVRELEAQYAEIAEAAGLTPEHMSSSDNRRLLEAEATLASNLKALGVKPLPVPASKARKAKADAAKPVRKVKA